jgi:hypothetical protein
LESIKEELETHKEEKEICLQENRNLKRQLEILEDNPLSLSPSFEKSKKHRDSTSFSATSEEDQQLHHHGKKSSASFSGQEWWQYIYLDLKNQRNMSIGIAEHGFKQKPLPGDYDYDASEHKEEDQLESDQMEFHNTKLRDNLRLQAIDMSILKQVIILSLV